jgi:hypothetical protein
MTNIPALLGRSRPKPCSVTSADTLPAASLHAAGARITSTGWWQLERSHARCTLRNFQQIFDTGRLAGLGLPVDSAGGPGHRAHSAPGLPLRPTREYFDPEKIVAAGHRVAAATRWLQHPGGIGRHRRASYRPQAFPYIVKLNHNEMLELPQYLHDQVMFTDVQQGLRHGRGGGGGHGLLRQRRESRPANL